MMFAEYEMKMMMIMMMLMVHGTVFNAVSNCNTAVTVSAGVSMSKRHSKKLYRDSNIGKSSLHPVQILILHGVSKNVTPSYISDNLVRCHPILPFGRNIPQGI